MSNIYLTKSKTSLYLNSYSSPLPPSKGNLLVNFISLTKRKLSLQFYYSVQPFPQQGDSPREQYLSDSQDNIIVHYQPFYPPIPVARKISS